MKFLKKKNKKLAFDKFCKILNYNDFVYKSVEVPSHSHFCVKIDHNKAYNYVVSLITN